MKRLTLLAVMLLFAATLSAQAATRPVTLSWTASTSNSVTGYSLYSCSSTTAVACNPNTSGTPAQTFTSTATSGVFQGTIGLYYTLVLIANAPSCTGTSSVTVACGNSAAVPFLPNPVPVPPQVNGATSVSVAVP